MKKMLFAALGLLLFTVGCYQYDAQFEGPYEDSQLIGIEPKIDYEILTVENGRIRLYNSVLKFNKVLTGLPLGIKKASINGAHDRIAYQVPGKDIAIVDSTGAPLGTVSNSANADWFDWHANDRSLYVLTKFKLTVWGNALTPAITNLAQLFPVSDNQEMLCAAVTEDGSVVVAYRFRAFLATFSSRIAVISPGGARWETPLGDYEHVHWMRASASGKQIAYGIAEDGHTPQGWILNVDAKSKLSLGTASFAAISPNNEYFSTWTSIGIIQVTNKLTGELFAFDNNAVVTALDW